MTALKTMADEPDPRSAAPVRAQGARADATAHSGADDASPARRPRSRSRGWLRTGAVVAAVLVATACSSIRLGYNNADTLLLYSLDSYFDLDDAQESLARERVRALLAWHRRTQLPDYAQLLDNAQRRLDTVPASPVSAQEVLAIQAQMGERLMTVGTQAAPDLARLARTLTPEQLAHYGAKVAKDNAKLRRERVQARDGGAGNGASSAYSEERIKRNIARARTWLGPLTAEQEQLIRDATLARPGGEQQWLQERERRQRELAAMLDRIRSEQLAPETGAALLTRYFTELSQPADPARRAAVLAARESNAQLMADLLNRATPEQKTALLRKLRGYAQDFTVLASEGGRG